MDSSIEEKQKYIKENITDKSLDPNLFTQFLQSKSESKEYNLDNFTMGELRQAVDEFTQQQNNANPSENPAPLINNNKEKKPTQKKKNIFESILGIKKKKKSPENVTPLNAKPEKKNKLRLWF